MVNDPVRAYQFAKTLQEIMDRPPASTLANIPRVLQLEVLVEIIRAHVRTDELQWALRDWITFTNTSYADTSQISDWYRQEFLD